jgi:hypothetical protein
MRFAIIQVVAPFALLVSASAAPAQQQAAACPADPVIPLEFAGWSSRTPMVAASKPSQLDKAALAAGHAIDAQLSRTSDVRYVTRPEKPGGTVSYGGMYSFKVERAGTYRIALASAAWIDVLRGKTAVESSSHGHGPDCSGIRKMVDFPLQPGRYVIQIAANGAQVLPFMILRLP